MIALSNLHRRLYLVGNIVGCLLAFLLTACAVVELDVDLYKGPLSNQEDVQIEQFAVLASAARPILMDLFYLMINETAQECNKYKDAELPPHCAKGQENGLENTPIYNDLIKNVNSADRVYARRGTPKRILDVISLYYDKDQMGEEAPEYSGLADVTRGLEPWYERTLVLRNKIAWNIQEERTAEAHKSVRELAILFLEFMQSIQDSDSSWTENPPKRLVMQNLAQSTVTLFHVRNLAATIHLLRDKSGLLEILRKNYGYNSVWSNEFENWQGRKYWRQIGLHKIVENDIASLLYQNPVEHGKLLRELIENSHLLANSIVEESINSLIPSLASAADKYINSSRNERLRYLGEDKKLFAELWPFREPHRKDSYAGSDFSEFGNLSIDNLNDVVSGIRPSLRSSFGNARLDEGLEQLMKDYVTVSDCRRKKPVSESTKDELCGNRKDNEDAKELARDRLLDSLIRFSQKVLYLADNEMLLRIGKKKENWLNIDSVDDTREYTLVLQSIGTAILVQANRLKSYEEYDTQQATDFKPELEAAKRAFDIPPWQALEELIKSLGADAEAAKKKRAAAKKALADATAAAEELRTELSILEGKGDFTKQKNVRALSQWLAAFQADKQKAVTAHRVVAKSPFSAEIQASVVGEEDKASEKVNPSAFAKEVLEAIARLRVAHENDKGLQTTEIFLKDETFKVADNETLTRDVAWVKYKEDFVTPLSEAAGKAIQDAVNLEKAAKAVLSLNQNFQKQKNSSAKFSSAAKEVSRISGAAFGTGDLSPDMPQRQVYKWLVRRVQHEIQSVPEPEVTPKPDVKPKPEVKPELQALLDTREILTESYTASVVRVTNPSPHLGEQKTAVAVVDDVLRQLEHQRIRFTQQYGPGSEPTKRITAAIKAASDYRAGKAFLMPPGAYLRSSYPASTLQSGSGVGSRRNILDRNAFRALLPFYPWGKGRNAEIQNEIDKQFWQTINTIKLAGTGRTNYVIAKDPTGNWYVKGYSSDPQDIIRSTKNLALFSMGSKMGTDLVNRDEEGRLEEPSQTRMGILFERYSGRYDAETKTHHAAIVKLLEDEVLQNSIKEGWKSQKVPDDKTALTGVVDEAAKILKEAHEQLKKSSPEKLESGATDVPNTRQAILTALSDIGRFHRTLDGAVRYTRFVDDDDENATLVLAYRGVAADITFAQLDQYLGKRKATVEKFDTAVTFIGEAVNEEEPAQKKAE